MTKFYFFVFKVVKLQEEKKKRGIFNDITNSIYIYDLYILTDINLFVTSYYSLFYNIKIKTNIKTNKKNKDRVGDKKILICTCLYFIT